MISELRGSGQLLLLQICHISGHAGSEPQLFSFFLFLPHPSKLNPRTGGAEPMQPPTDRDNRILAPSSAFTLLVKSLVSPSMEWG